MGSASDRRNTSATSATLTSDEIEARAEALLATYLDDFTAARTNPANRLRWWMIKPMDTEAGQRILAEERRLQAVLVRRATLAYAEYVAATVAAQWDASGRQRLTTEQHQLLQRNHWNISAASAIIIALCRRTLPMRAEDILAIADAVSGLDTRYSLHLPVLPLIRVMRPALQDDAVMARCRPALERCRTVVKKLYPSAHQRTLAHVMDELLADAQAVNVVAIYADEWGDQINPLLTAMAPQARERWLALLTHCATAHGSTPSEKWLRAGHEVRAALGVEIFAAGASDLLAAFRKSANKPPAHEEHSFKLLNNGSVLDERNADLLRGLPQDHRARAALHEGGQRLRLRAATRAASERRRAIGARPP